MIYANEVLKQSQEINSRILETWKKLDISKANARLLLANLLDSRINVESHTTDEEIVTRTKEELSLCLNVISQIDSSIDKHLVITLIKIWTFINEFSKHSKYIEDSRHMQKLSVQLITALVWNPVRLFNDFYWDVSKWDTKTQWLFFMYRFIMPRFHTEVCFYYKWEEYDLKKLRHIFEKSGIEDQLNSRFNTKVADFINTISNI